MISKNRLAFAAISAGLVTSLLGMGAAQADPSGAPSPRALVGVGSDTTQDVMNQIANDVVISGVKQIGSFNATGSATFNTGKAGCSAVARPNGSGAGRAALLASLTAGDGCIQFSRSSSLTLTASSPSLTYVPYAIDAVSYAITSNSNLPRSFALADLQAIYHCDPNYVGTGPNYAITPQLPQAGSGTRSYWEGQMGILDADVNANVYPCIVNGTKNGAIIEEHTGTALDANSIAPFSIGQYTDQSNGLIIDRRGTAVLGVIAGTDPQLINNNFSIKRDVYNVIPTSQIAAAPYSTVFVGAGSLVCQDTATILHYGFAVNPNCGSTTNHS
ncbi:substrate-binding domain-containing protein [Acidothermaceae bacterium B102]|nr:substrate-binding domain-containing protein [Acidothermaceae bacterium B102]